MDFRMGFLPGKERKFRVISNEGGPSFSCCRGKKEKRDVLGRVRALGAVASVKG